MELALLQFGKKVVQPETVKDFPDMLLVGFHVPGVNKDVIEVDDDTDVEHVGKDSIYKTLECCRGISEAKRHY